MLVEFLGLAVLPFQAGDEAALFRGQPLLDPGKTLLAGDAAR
jgi:hypothetical protein